MHLRRFTAAGLMLIGLLVVGTEAQTTPPLFPTTRPAGQAPRTGLRAAPSADSLLPATTRPVAPTTKPAGPTTRPGLRPVPSAESLLPPTSRPVVKVVPTTTRPAVAVTPATLPMVAAWPSTKPVKSMTADEMLSQMLKPVPGGPTTGPADEVADTTPGGFVPAKSIPEGSYVHDVVGSIEMRGSPRQPEFSIEGRTGAPPIVLLPCLTLMMMEDAVAGTDRPVKFRLSGTATEYNGKNYLLPEQVIRGGKPLRGTVPPPGVDRKSGESAAKPGAPTLTVVREGTYIVDRIGRLTRSPDGKQFEFTFEADRGAMRDPPVVILQGNKLAGMENAVVGSSRDVRFRATGLLTEYRGRNFLMIDKVVVVPEVTLQF